MGAKLPHY